MADWISDTQKIGIGLTGFGALFTTLGVILFFDTGLLAIGNLMFLAGVTLMIGPHKAFIFFFQQRKWKGAVTFFGGILLVLLKWPVIGMCVETFGFINLFGDFFPTVIRFLRAVPIVGRIFEIPVIRQLVDRYVGGKLPV